MSANESSAHESPIKTPRQLITVVALAFIVPIVAIILLAQLIVTTAMRSDKDNPAMSAEAVAARIKPVAEVSISGESAAAKAAKSGEEVVQSTCFACHGSGAANAPKIGDARAWGPLIKRGLDNLTKSAIAGIRGMPAKGGNAELSEVEISRAIVAMANQSGAKFKQPAAPAAAPVAAPAAAPAAKADGKAVYQATCIACHATGVAGAPKAGDKASWAPRIKTGMETLYASSLKGKGAMPPKGGNASLPEADVKAAVDYLVGMSK